MENISLGDIERAGFFVISRYENWDIKAPRFLKKWPSVRLQ